MCAFPFAMGFDDSDTFRLHLQVRLHFPEMRKRVADYDVLASRKRLSRHPLAPSMCVPDARRVVLISAIDLKEHVRFEMLEINLGEHSGHGGLATSR